VEVMGKVVLVNPPTREHAYRELKKFAFLAPPMGLAYVAAYLQQQKIPVSLIDSDPLELDLEQTVKKIVSEAPAYVGITAMTATMGIAGRLIKKVRVALPEVKIILGGVHGSALPRRTLKEFPVLDFVVRQEGEYTTFELIKVLENAGKLKDLQQVEGITFRYGGEIYHNEPRPFIENLDELPFPARQMLPIDTYQGPGWFRWSQGYRGPFLQIFTSRGCPYNCNFCASHLMCGRKARYRSVENVMEEIDLLVHKYKAKILSIEDDTFTVNRKRALSICQELIKRDYKLHIMCETRVDLVDEELLDTLKRAGVEWLFLGVESGNAEILKATRKGITVEQVKKAFQLIKRVGIGTNAGFILGHLGETWDTAGDTIRLLRELMPDYAGIATLIPFPGSRLWDYCLENDTPLPSDWNGYGMVNAPPISINPGLSSKQLIKLRDRAILTYYGNPKRFWRMFIRYNKYRLICDHIYNAYALLLRKMRLSRKLKSGR